MNRVAITKQFETETSHIVREAYSTRCAFNIHGHSYVWEIGIGGEVEEDGMVLDFKKLNPIKEFIDKFDHANVFWSKEEEKIINFFKDNFKRVIVMNKNCTAENMAKLLHRFVQEFLQVNYPRKTVVYAKVWETRKASAEAYSSDSEDTIVYMHNEEN